MIRVVLLLITIGFSYIPYIVLFHHVASNIYEALLLTVALPLGAVCFFANAFLENIY